MIDGAFGYGDPNPEFDNFLASLVEEFIADHGQEAAGQMLSGMTEKDLWEMFQNRVQRS
jgi:hypothetical protein